MCRDSSGTVIPENSLIRAHGIFWDIFMPDLLTPDWVILS